MRSGFLIVAVAAFVAAGLPPVAQERGPDEPPWQAFIAAAGTDPSQAQAAEIAIAARWRDGYAAMIVDVARFLPSPRGPRAAEDQPSRNLDDPVDEERSAATVARGEFPALLPRERVGADTRRRLTNFLERQTGKRLGDDLRAWRRWVWALPYAPHQDYAAFKAELYARVDPRFREFFFSRARTTIRLDEVDWGGVGVNGIPPLRAPKIVPATQATWLRDGHVVFGIVVNGAARAYPKRILAWHEMAIDRLGGVDLTVVYCTLCGTVIPYESRTAGRRFTFGTSGLLYRSNKLMFDEETRSLWSSLKGVPVVGSLVGSGLQLPFHAVVTTTWGEWKREHPSTTVLSLETGYERDYAEGAAYRDYFATDRLMFELPAADARLKNKVEVLVLRPDIIGQDASPVAISVDRLRRDPLYVFEAGGRGFLVVTSKGGGNVVYERSAHTFPARGADGVLRDATGGRWFETDEALVSDAGVRLARVPAHRAFWFGWVAQYPETVLHK